MTAKEIKKTPWYKDFARENKSSAAPALNYAADPNERFEIVRNDEMGIWQYAIVPQSDPTFWMDATKTKTAATALCKVMGWKLL